MHSHLIMDSNICECLDALMAPLPTHYLQGSVKQEKQQKRNKLRSDKATKRLYSIQRNAPT